MTVLKIDCLTNSSGCFEVDFLEREATPVPALKPDIRLRLEEVPYLYNLCILYGFASDAVSLLFTTGCRKPIYSR